MCTHWCCVQCVGYTKLCEEKETNILIFLVIFIPLQDNGVGTHYLPRLLVDPYFYIHPNHHNHQILRILCLLLYNVSIINYNASILIEYSIMHIIPIAVYNLSYNMKISTIECVILINHSFISIASVFSAKRERVPITRRNTSSSGSSAI